MPDYIPNSIHQKFENGGKWIKLIKAKSKTGILNAT
jgi:hypothetical protein